MEDKSNKVLIVAIVCIIIGVVVGSVLMKGNTIGSQTGRALDSDYADMASDPKGAECEDGMIWDSTTRSCVYGTIGGGEKEYSAVSIPANIQKMIDSGYVNGFAKTTLSQCQPPAEFQDGICIYPWSSISKLAPDLVSDFTKKLNERIDETSQTNGNGRYYVWGTCQDGSIGIIGSNSPTGPYLQYVSAHGWCWA